MDERKGLLIVGLLAFVTRVPFFSINRGLLYDEALYLSIARNLAFNLSNYTMNFNYMTYRPPFLPYLLSFFFKLGITDGIGLVSPLFSMATILLTYYYAKKHFSHTIALIASLILVTSPLFFKYSTRMLAHEIYAFFYTLSVFLFLEGQKEKRKLYWAGAIASLAFLTRYVGLMFFSFVFFYFLFGYLKSTRTLLFLPERNMALLGCLLSFFLVIAPWSFFSYQIYGDPLKYAKVASAVITLDSTATFYAFLLATFVEVTPWILFFFLLGISIIMRKRDSFVLAWLAGSFSVFLTVTHKESRYLVDFFPLIAITSAVGFEALDERVSRKKFWIAFSLLSLMSFLVGIVDVYGTRDVGEPLIHVGSFLSKNTPLDFAIVANEESQIYYYTGRKVYPFPKSKEDFERLVSEKRIMFVVVNLQEEPDYAKEALAGWNIVFLEGGHKKESYKIYGRRIHGNTFCLFG